MKDPALTVALYYNYHLHPPFRATETSGRGHDPRERDFRAMRKKEREEK